MLGLGMTGTWLTFDQCRSASAFKWTYTVYSLTPSQLETCFWGQNYLDLVQGGVRGCVRGIYRQASPGVWLQTFSLLTVRSTVDKFQRQRMVQSLNPGSGFLSQPVSILPFRNRAY